MLNINQYLFVAILLSIDVIGKESYRKYPGNHHGIDHRLSLFDNDDCLRCICAASSGCQKNSRCRVIEPDKYLCGPFRLSESYWKLANNNSSSNRFHWFDYPLEFEHCAHDLQCSIRIVKNFMRNFFHEKCPQLLRKLLENNHTATIFDQCTRISLIHYRAIYGSEDLSSTWDNCHHINIDVDEQIEWLRKNLPATRSDNYYWNNFFWCSKLYLQQ